MKSAIDPRHLIRRKAVQELFASSYTNQKVSSLTKKVLAQKKPIDQKIVKAAPSWPIKKLNRIDLAILRLAIFELKKKETPPKVIIDEAVELAKEFGADNSASFVNGVLGTIVGEE